MALVSSSSPHLIHMPSHRFSYFASSVGSVTTTTFCAINVRTAPWRASSLVCDSPSCHCLLHLHELPIFLSALTSSQTHDFCISLPSSHIHVLSLSNCHRLIYSLTLKTSYSLRHRHFSRRHCQISQGKT